VTEYTGRTLDGYSAIVGPPVVRDGTFVIGAPGDARNVRVAIESQTYLPFTIASAEWEGHYAQRTRQL
jgi:hypothetical protein